MLSSPETAPWAEFEIQAELNSWIDRETINQRIAEVVSPMPHLVFLWASTGETDEGFFSFTSYYANARFKSDLPEEQAHDLMKSAVDAAMPGTIESWLSLQIVHAETTVQVAQGIAKDTAEVAATVSESAGKVGSAAMGVIEAAPTLAKNAHWIAIGLGVTAVVIGLLYFGPQIKAFAA